MSKTKARRLEAAWWHFAALAVSCGLACIPIAYASAPLDWRDTDGDGLDGREQALELRCAGDVCLDQYTGEAIARADVEVDHILPRKRAAELYDKGERWIWRLFVNDQANLALTSRAINRAKSARGPEQFCPPLVSARAWYAERYRLVAQHYNIRLTDGEERALQALVAGQCAGGSK